MRRLALIAALTALHALAAPAHAQNWPTRPVTMIVPFAAGGPIDTVARILSPGLTQALGQQMVVEDIGGAGGMTGDSRLARSDPDGYTFGFGNQATHTFSQFIYRKPLYDPFKDFAPIGLVVSNSKVLVVRKDLPVNNLKEFIAYARKNQDKMQYGSAGGGSATQIACVLLNQKIGAPRVTHVPYRGTALAMQDLMAGRIDYLCDITSTAQPHVSSGQVKAIAVLAKARSEAMPNVPTALEEGLANVDSDGWNAFFAPAKTPKEIIAKINEATSKTLDDPAVLKRLSSLGLTVPPKSERSPEFLNKLVKDELAKWGPVIKAANIGQK